MIKSNCELMKPSFLLFLIGIVILSCKKEKIPITQTTNYYQSKGNLLIVKIDDDLESIFEYNLTSTELINDSLPLIVDSYSIGLTNYTCLRFVPNPDTLFQYSSNNFTFFTPKIDKSEFQILINPIPFDSSQFQLIGAQDDFDFSSVWAKISRLDIVKTYRNSHPDSKIGIDSFVINEYDEQLGFSTPTKKYLIFLVK